MGWLGSEATPTLTHRGAKGVYIFDHGILILSIHSTKQVDFLKNKKYNKNKRQQFTFVVLM